MKVLIYVDTSKDVGDVDHLKVFANEDERPGLRFEDFEEGMLDLSRLKTGKSAVFDIDEYPLFQLALSAVPEDEQTGPLVTDTDGDPVRYRVFYGMYRDVAAAAGVPKEVWNSRARHRGARRRLADRRPPTGEDRRGDRA